VRFPIAGLLALALAGCATADYFSNPGTVPVNDLPDPYKTIAPWGKLPADHPHWGALNAVAVDNDGRSLWVADRCGPPRGKAAGVPGQLDSCEGSSWAPVHKLDADGNIVRSFGAGMFLYPHKIYQDRAGDVWVVDMRAGKAVKFTPEGKVLLVIDKLTEPCSIVEGSNGELFIAEGHSGQEPGAGPATVARISRFTKEGKFLRSFGRWGSGNGEFKTPHDLAMDGHGNLVVADRGNNRVQILTEEGKFLASWNQFGRPSGIAIRRYKIYVADSESNGVAPHPGWQRGIRVGDFPEGKVLYRIPDPQELEGTSGAEGVAVDEDGNVYAGEVGQRQLVKHVPLPQN
jgi:DNA-binding beta-propeller fold protein YncE